MFHWPFYSTWDPDKRNETDHCPKPDHTRCQSGRYVNNDDLCDGRKNCEDGSDESELHCKGRCLMIIGDGNQRQVRNVISLIIYGVNLVRKPIKAKENKCIFNCYYELLSRYHELQFVITN